MGMRNSHDLVKAGAGKIPVLSFFSGAGFLDIGFLRQGNFDFVWHNECHEPFARAYEHGVGALGYNTSNNKIQSRAKIENLKPEKVRDQAFGNDIPEIFGVIGGPPCPDFSRAGKNEGGKGENGRLTAVFIRMILKLRPTFFLLENVPGLLETKKHRAFLFSQLKKMSKYYVIDMRVLNALEYGVPQSRRRLFIVGFLRDWTAQNLYNSEWIEERSAAIVSMDVSDRRTSSDVEKDLEKNRWFGWPEETYEAEALKGKCPKELTVKKHFKGIKKHPNAKDIFHPYSKKFKSIKEGDVSRKSFKRLARNFYSPNAAYGNNEVHVHPTENRRISVAEALSLQSVPYDYNFPSDMTLSAKFKAVCNGVPVPMASRMAKSIFQFVQERKDNGKT